MSETEKMNVQAQGEERAAQEYVQTQELTRNEIMDMAVVMKGVRDYTVSTQNESRLQSVLQSVAVAVVKKFIAVATNNVVGFLEKQALKASLNYLKEIDKQTMLGMMNQGISTLESLANTMTQNPTWQKIRVDVGMLRFSEEQVQDIISCGNIKAVQINGSWQN